MKSLKNFNLNINVLINNCQWGILICDEKDTVGLMNEGLKDLFDIQRVEDYIGKSYEVLMSDMEGLFIDSHFFFDRGKDLIERREVLEDEELILKNEEIIRMDFNPLFLGGNYVGCFWQFFNITHRIESKKRQYQLTKDLELANNDLIDFNYFISHDLKSPLRTVYTLANWILNEYEKDLKDGGLEQMELLISSVERMEFLIDGILEYTKTGRKNERKEKVDLNEVLERLIKSYQIPEGVRIIIHRLPSIEIEMTQVLQVFDNLINNSIKYMNKSEGEIEVNYEECEGWHVFSVKDNGPGIELEDWEKVFKLFYTSNGGDRKSHGLGLAIVKKIIGRYEGRVWLESEVGEGCEFFFSLPRKKV